MAVIIYGRTTNLKRTLKLARTHYLYEHDILAAVITPEVDIPA